MLKLEASSFIQDEYCSCNVAKHIVSEVELGWSLWIGHLDYPLFHLQLKRSHCTEQNIALHNHTSLFVKLITQKGTQGELWAPWDAHSVKQEKPMTNNGCAAYATGFSFFHLCERDPNLFACLLRCTAQLLQFVKVVILFQAQCGIIL